MYVPVCTKYIPSTAQVRVGTYLQRFWNSSTNKYVLGMAACIIGTYYAIVQYHLVLLYTGTYYLVRRFTILVVSSFRFGTSYVESWTVISAVQLSTYEVPNRKEEILRIVNRRTR